MKALHDDDCLLCQLKLMALPFPLTGLEIKGGQFDCFTSEQCVQMCRKQIRIDGVDVLKVDFSIGARLNKISVQVLVIETHEDRLFTMNPQLRRKSIG